MATSEPRMAQVEAPQDSEKRGKLCTPPRAWWTPFLFETTRPVRIALENLVEAPANLCPRDVAMACRFDSMA